jgi:hypothetical protein
MNVLTMIPDFGNWATSASVAFEIVRIESHRILVEPSASTLVDEESRWLSVGDHNDLPHILPLRKQNAARQSQAFTSCFCVIGPDLNAGEPVEWNLFGGIVERAPGEGCHRILAAYQMC